MNDFAVLLDCICLLPPQEIPSECAVSKWIKDRRSHSREDAQPSCFQSRTMGSYELEASLRQCIAAVAWPESLMLFEERKLDDAAHDTYFHVQRIVGEPPAVFARMALSARLILVQEIHSAPFNVQDSVVESLDRGLTDLCAAVAGDKLPYATTWQIGTTALRPMARWVRGHQLFAALSQGLIFALNAMAEAIRQDRSDAVRRWADLSLSLLRASGAAFVLTGDFAAEDYERLVRPSMMPPLCAINLSGLMSADHRFLVQVLRDMRPALRALHEQEPVHHAALERELAVVYDNHIHVCERFVGEQPSLLTARHGTKSGPALIEQFKLLRMKAFEAPAHAPRLPLPSAPAARCPVQHPSATDVLATAHKGTNDLP